VGGARLLGLLNFTVERWFQGEFYFGDHALKPDDVQRLIDARAEAKRIRDFTAADQIREELRSKGILLEDSSTGTTWRRA
jgi:cysteinyl-tRNA synthetase